MEAQSGESDGQGPVPGLAEPDGPPGTLLPLVLQQGHTIQSGRLPHGPVPGEGPRPQPPLPPVPRSGDAHRAPRRPAGAVPAIRLDLCGLHPLQLYLLLSLCHRRPQRGRAQFEPRVPLPGPALPRSESADPGISDADTDSCVRDHILRVLGAGWSPPSSSPPPSRCLGSSCWPCC